MAFGPRARKAALLVHVPASIGWFGTDAGCLARAISGATSSNPELTRACYAVMGVIGWAAIVPAALASFASGVVSSLGTQWGLFRYYWVTIKFTVTVTVSVIATAVLLVHMQPITHVAALAANPAWDASTAGGLRSLLVPQSVLAILALDTATVTTLSVYEPPGRTQYGIRCLAQQRTS